MDSTATFVSRNEWSSQSSHYGKLGDYFDRPDWWKEGAETLQAFFNGDTPRVDTTDQRLEDLLDLIGPLNVGKEPSRSRNAGTNLGGLVENTTDLPALQREAKYDLKHDEVQSVEPGSNDTRLQAENVNPSSDSFSANNSVHVEFEEESEVAPATSSGSKDSQSHSDDPALLRTISILNTSISSDATNTSSPLFTGTTTSTRQTSPQPELSTRASSRTAVQVVSFDSSLENETTAPSPAEVPKLGSFVRNATHVHKNDSPPELFERNNNSVLTDADAPVGTNIASIPIEHTTNEHSATLDEVTAVSEDDPTGLQAVKDETSDANNLPKAIDSSILAQEDDDTVVHDPSAAAISIFPPNPYSDTQFDSSFYVAQAPSLTVDGELGNDSHEHIDDSSADSTLTSLAAVDGQLPESQFVDQVNGRERYTPSAPAFSPLTPPPPDFVDTVNADVMDEVKAGEGDNSTPLEIASTSNQPITRFGNVTHEHPAGDNTLPLPNIKVLNTANEAVEELAHDNVVDGTQPSTNPLALVHLKRKQEHPHPDEPTHKKPIPPTTEDRYDPEAKAKAVPASEDETAKGKSKQPAQKGKSKAGTKSAQRDSPDELASASSDELADSSVSSPFILSKNSQNHRKPKLDRSTTSRSHVKKPIDAAPPLRKLIGVPKFTRGGVGRRELAELLGASPPRAAAEKQKVDSGGRLRTQSQTPAPASAPGPPFATQASLVATVSERNETGTSAQQKRKRPTGSNPVSAQELTDLGNTPILKTRTRTRTATVEPTPEPATQLAAKAAPKRTKSAISKAEVERLGVVEMTESRTRNSTLEPTSEPTIAPALAKRAKKPATKPVAQIGGKPNPFALTSKPKGTPRTSRKKEPPEKKAVGLKQDKDSPPEKQTKPAAKRKRGEESEEVGEVAARASKRIAGVEAEGV